MRRALVPGVGLLCLLPLGLIGADLARGELTEPVEQILNRLGFWTLTFLVLTLACTPAKLLFGWTWPNRVRRLLGLVCFAYALLHFLTYAILDQELGATDLMNDLSKRPFITVGYLALGLLVPLAWTSRDSMVRRLGFKRWKQVHRAVYVVAGLGTIHFLWRVKADQREPLIFAGVFAALLAVRVVAAWRARRRAKRPTRVRQAT